MSHGPTIGIDLGTSNSCVGAMVDGSPRVFADEQGRTITPSVVYFADDGRIVVGHRAKSRVVIDPRNTISSAKRLMGRYAFSEEVKKARAVCRYEIVGQEDHSIRIQVREEEYSVPEISSFVLREMKRIAEQNLGREITRAVITVPAYFNDNQRQATKDAARIAGLEVARILNEPTAAALAYGFGKDLRQRVAVYDLGGGTFDVSVLEIGENVFEVLSTAGDTYLGGDDFDDRLIDLLADQVQEQHGLNVRSDIFALEKLKVAAEQAKIGLSSSDRVHVEIPGLTENEGESIDLSYDLERPVFEKLVRDLILRTFKVCDEAMQQANLTTRDLDGVIMVGGPTRLPTIRKAVSEYFQRQPEADINPDEVVAMGAGIHAASLDSETSDSFLLDVTPLSLRLAIAGGQSEVIIERNSPVPIEHRRVFSPARDNQATVSVQIYQGESRAVEGNELLGAFEFSGFEPGPREEVKIEVCFEITTDGTVGVVARDVRTGQQHATKVSMSSGLSEQEIQAIIARGAAEAAARAAASGQPPETEADEEILGGLPRITPDPSASVAETPRPEPVAAAAGPDETSRAEARPGPQFGELDAEELGREIELVEEDREPPSLALGELECIEDELLGEDPLTFGSGDK